MIRDQPETLTVPGKSYFKVEASALTVLAAKDNMPVLNKKLLRMVLPPNWREVRPDDRGYCYLYCIEHKYQQRMAYYLGAQPDWEDVLSCGCLRRTAVLGKRKNKDGTYHVYPSTCGVTPSELRFPPGAMVGNGPLVTTCDIIETIILSVFGSVLLGGIHLGLAIERAFRRRSLGSVDFALYGICLLLLNPAVMAAQDSRRPNGMEETIDLDSPTGDSKNNAYRDLHKDLGTTDDDEEYIPPIIFKDVEERYIINMDFDLPDYMLCVSDDSFRHELLTVGTNKKTLKEYFANRCPQLEFKPNDMWFKQALLYDKKYQQRNSNNYSQLAKSAAEKTNDGLKEALKTVGLAVSETASLTSEFIAVTGNLLENTSKDTINVLKRNNNAISDSAAKVKGWTEKVIEASPDVEDMIDVGIVTISELHKFADVLTTDVRSGERIGEVTKLSVKAALDEIGSVTTTVYDSTRNVVKQAHDDSFESKQMSHWIRESFYDLVEFGKQTPAETFGWAKDQEYMKMWTETVEGVPWLAKAVGKTIAAPIMGVAEELDGLDNTWFSAKGLANYKKAVLGDWSEFSFWEKKGIFRKNSVFNNG